MSLLAAILELDEQVFLSLNSLFPASSDTFWLAVTKTITWIPLYVVILARLIKTVPNHSAWLFRIALTIVGVLIWDQGASLFKEWIARPRPCQEEIEGIRVLVNCSPYGFVSAHAANAFGLAFLMRKWLKPSWFPILLVVALLQSFSRIHLGVHYPLDLIFGGLWGILISTILVRIDQQFS
jgi:undecaprenyl-diphosphatase